MHCLLLNTLNDLLKTRPNVVISGQHLADNLVKLLRIPGLQVIETIDHTLKVKSFGLDIVVLQRRKVGYLKDDHSKYENIRFLLLILIEVIIIY